MRLLWLLALLAVLAFASVESESALSEVDLEDEDVELVDAQAEETQLEADDLEEEEEREEDALTEEASEEEVEEEEDTSFAEVYTAIRDMLSKNKPKKPKMLQELQQKASLSDRFHNKLSGFQYPKKNVRDPVKGLADLKAWILASVTPSDILPTMMDIYKTLMIVTADGKLNEAGLPALKGQENIFFEEPNLPDFLNRIEGCAQQNDYLMDVIAKTPNFFPVMTGKGSAKNVLTLSVSLSMVFERFNKVVVTDFKLLEQTLTYWPNTFVEARGLNRLVGGTEGWKKRPIFGKTKYVTVEYCMKKVVSGFDDIHSSLDPEFLKYLIPINIYEAVAMDVVHKMWDNVRTGRVLAAHKPGTKKLNPRTGAGPSQLHVKNVNKPNAWTIWLKFALGENWGDLYGVWNMAFVSREYEQFPLFYAKLLTPPVLCQPNHPTQGPDEYIYQRGIALWTMANFVVSRPIEENNNWGWHEPKADFDKWIGIFGAINRHSSKHYEDAVAYADSQPPPVTHVSKTEEQAREMVAAANQKDKKDQPKPKMPKSKKKRFPLVDDFAQWIQQVQKAAQSVANTIAGVANNAANSVSDSAQQAAKAVVDGANSALHSLGLDAKH